MFQTTRGIVDDRRAAILLQKGAREQAHDVIPVDEAPLFVEEEAAVEIAVEGDAQVGARKPHRAACHFAILFEHRVRHAVREVAVGFVMDLGEAERQLFREQVERDAGAAIAAVADDRERPQLVDVDIRKYVIAPGRLDVEGHDVAAPGRIDELAGLGELADVLEARVLADRPRLFAHELEAVVVRRIVARRDHDPAVEPERRGREIHHLRAAEADVHDVDAGIAETAHQRAREFLARMADVAADGDPLGLQPLGISPPDPVHGVRIQLVRYATADVVGLEAFREIHVPYRLR